MSSAAGTAPTGVDLDTVQPLLEPSDRMFFIGLWTVVLSLLSALLTFLILTGLTPIIPTSGVVLSALFATIAGVAIIAVAALAMWPPSSWVIEGNDYFKRSYWEPAGSATGLERQGRQGMALDLKSIHKFRGDMLGIGRAAPVAKQENFVPGGHTGHQHLGGGHQRLHLLRDRLPLDADAVFHNGGDGVLHGVVDDLPIV